MEPRTTLLSSDLSPVDGYKLMTGIIVPRPIAWVGTQSAEGVNNLAPFSFFNGLCANPPTIVFSVGVNPRVKDTALNVAETGVFTVSIVTTETAHAMNVTAADFEHGVDEFAEAGMTAVPGNFVDAPMVAEATANLECRHTQTVDLGPEGGPTSNRAIFGEVVAFHIADRVLDGTRIDPVELAATGRLAGSSYTSTVDGLFELERP